MACIIISENGVHFGDGVLVTLCHKSRSAGAASVAQCSLDHLFERELLGISMP